MVPMYLGSIILIYLNNRGFFIAHMISPKKHQTSLQLAPLWESTVDWSPIPHQNDSILHSSPCREYGVYYSFKTGKRNMNAYIYIYSTGSKQLNKKGVWFQAFREWFLSQLVERIHAGYAISEQHNYSTWYSKNKTVHVYRLIYN